MTLVEECLQSLKERRQNILNGNVNCIPSPYKRFINDFVGIEKETYYVITSFTKGGKTQFTSYTFLYYTLLFIYYTKSNINLTIHYFALEESPKRIMERFMSWLLNDWTKEKIHISPRDLRSTTEACPEEAINMLETDELKDIEEFFESHIKFSLTDNPTGIDKEIKEYARAHGKETKSTFEVTDEFGNTITKEKFQSYTPDDPNEYHMIFVDTINNVELEKGCYSKKDAMDRVSKSLRIARNNYKYIPVVIQQQAFESEGNEAFKLGKIRPSVAGLGDSKYVSRDANVVLGLFSPFRFGLKEYFGYDISKFKDNIRFLEVIVNRDGEMGGLIALYFDGATCQFKELPPASDKEALQKVYDYLEHKRAAKLKGRVNMLIGRIVNKFKK